MPAPGRNARFGSDERRADHAEQQVAAGSGVVEGVRPAHEAVRVRHDIIFLAGHFSANSALAADFATSVLTTELAAATTDFNQHHRLQCRLPLGLQPGRRRRDTGRHAATRLGANLRSEAGNADRRNRLPVRRHRLPRVQRTPLQGLRAAIARRPAGTAVAVGEALVQAKLAYLAATPDIRGLHEKALLQATLFGLPMLGVNMPSGRGAIPGTSAAITPDPVPGPSPAATLGCARRTSVSRRRSPRKRRRSGT